MAPTPKAQTIITTPSWKPNHTHQTHSKTPHSKHRLNFNTPKPSPNPKETQPPDHPVEVIARIRDYPDKKDKPISALLINPDHQSLRLKTDFGYRDFTLDGLSLSEEEDLDGFYKKFVESRINGVKLGDKCTIMMYGPTGSGKSHTMFGCAKHQGIVYKSLRDILGDGVVQTEVGVGTFVQVTVLEIYNEEIYDLLLPNNNAGGFSLGWTKANCSKVRLEVMGKKAKNASFISGNEAGKISKEIQKVEKRRIVKSTLCNERSSRSHCMIILDVPMVGGRLMLVDMAGSENIEQAGQTGLEAKMQTAKINQGNTALKRVVESIANGDSHVPFRDSKLTMLLQDSFEDDKSKILMILCASPDPKEMHKTISTLEYGAKAKCIIRGPHTPMKEKGTEDYSSSAVILGSRIAAMDQFIYKLQMENKVREKETNDAHKELMKKEEEVSALRAKLVLMEEKKSVVPTSEEEINMKVNERTEMLKIELEKKIRECKKMADEYVEMERRKMEERILQQQQELEILRRRLEEIESELTRSRDENGSTAIDGSSFARRLLEVYSNEDPGMEKSMDLDKSMEFDMGKRDGVVDFTQPILGNPQIRKLDDEEDQDVFLPNYATKTCLSTVFEEEEEEEDKEKPMDEEVMKEVIEEKRTVYSSGSVDSPSHDFNFNTVSGLLSAGGKNEASSIQTRIQNIFTLCGHHRELSQHTRTPVSTKKRSANFGSPLSPLRSILEDPAQNLSVNLPNLTEKMKKIRTSDEKLLDSKENCNPTNDSMGDMEVYVKWEASKENPGKLIRTFKVSKDSTLSDLRKMIEIRLGADNQPFTFLVLGDPTGAPVPREEEATVQVSKLPICNNGHLACLRSIKGFQCLSHLPFSPLQNKLPLTPIPHMQLQHQINGLSPKLAQHLSSTPFITLRRNLPKSNLV